MLRPLSCFSVLATALALSACQPASNNQNSTPATAEDSKPNSAAHVQSTPNTSWQGRYTGLLPCADCSGIRTTIELDDDKSFEMTEQYTGKGYIAPTKTEGEFHFDPNTPNLIELKSKDFQRKFSIGEQTIEARAMEDGSALSELYTLYKLTEVPEQSSIKDLDISAYHMQPTGKNEQLHHYYVELENEGSSTIQLNAAQFKLQDDQGKTYLAKHVDPELTIQLAPKQIVSGEVHFNYANSKIVQFHLEP